MWSTQPGTAGHDRRGGGWNSQQQPCQIPRLAGLHIQGDCLLEQILILVRHNIEDFKIHDFVCKNVLSPD